MTMDKPEICELQELLILIKEHTHELNRTFFSSEKNKNQTFLFEIQYIWGNIQNFRSKIELPDEEPYLSIQKIAGQLSRMRNLIIHNQFEQSRFENEYLILRRFVEQYEKNLVRTLYFNDTGVWSEKIGNLRWAAKLAGKSEVTIRRYVFDEKIKAYKIIKIWWVPYEEIKNKLN